MADSIGAVIRDLDHIVETATAEGDRVGYFAAVYRRVTHSVRDAIDAGVFDDAERMEQLDVVFANRFVDAWKHHQAGRTPTESWKLAFQAARNSGPLILQHLLLGMNAHINLDLGVAAASVAPGSAINELQADFFRINDILGKMVSGFVREIGEVSPWIAIVDRVSGDGDDELIRFSLAVARSEAWAFAQQLAALGPTPEGSRATWDADRNAAINSRDHVVAVVGRDILSPGPIIGGAVWLARQRESSNVRRVINHLA